MNDLILAKITIDRSFPQPIELDLYLIKFTDRHGKRSFPQHG